MSNPAILKPLLDVGLIAAIAAGLGEALIMAGIARAPRAASNAIVITLVSFMLGVALETIARERRRSHDHFMRQVVWFLIASALFGAAVYSVARAITSERGPWDLIAWLLAIVMAGPSWSRHAMLTRRRA